MLVAVFHIQMSSSLAYENNKRTRRFIQRRVTSFFEFMLPFPPWMS